MTQPTPTCREYGATTPQEAKARCTRTSAKDTCHGCELWPDEIRFDTLKPLTVEGVQALADQIAAVEPMTEPPVDDILALAAVIRRVDGNHSLGAARLAEAILECWIPPVKVVEKPAIGQISDLADAIRSSKAVEDYWINYFGRDSLAAVLSRLDGNDSRGAAALAEEILRHWQPQQPAAKPAPTTERTAIIARLRELSHAVTQGPETVRREFDMRVPVEPLRDADFVLSTAARMLEADRAQPVKVTDEELLRTYGLAKRDYCYEGPDDDWPKRAERAATICGLRAVFARCGHSVEPVTTPTPSTEKLFREIDQLLDGIDRCSDHPDGGWWETVDGARFGRIKFRELKEFIARHLSPPQP